MAHFKLGIVLEPLGLPLKPALDRAARIGAQAVQIDAVGVLRPEALSDTGRRELRAKLRALNLDLAALAVPLRRGLDVADDQQARIDHIQKVMTLAYELGSRLVVAPCPKLPEADSPRGSVLPDSLRALAAFGDRHGVRLALEGGLDASETFRDYLAAFDPGLAVTIDPANFLGNGHDPYAALSQLSSRLAHVQARDLRLGNLSGGVKEVAVGAGEVDWFTLFGTLDALGYAGAVVVDREDGPQRAADVQNGLQFLRRFARPQDS